MATVTPFAPRVPWARRDLARYLRDLAAIIENNEADVEPNAALIVLTGRTHHEVLWVGATLEPGFAGGAVAAASAVVNAPFETEGRNWRPRTHGYQGGRIAGEVLPLRRPAPDAED